MNVVLDTNVIISALLSPTGAPAQVLDYWREGLFTVISSPQLIDELKRALTYSRVVKYLKLSDEDIDLFLKYFRQFSEVVEPDFSLDILKEDPDDNRVLECAAAGSAAYIITGDKHLVAFEEFRGMVILSPIHFISVINT